jgi:2-keto-4-pentenoate hydratase/2-oxohepta-3-ene-1,7-dioic acid hydratase in catechol pathway
MKLVSYDAGRLGVVRDQSVVDVTDLVTDDPTAWPPVAMVQLVNEFERLRPAIEERLTAASGTPLADVRLEAPITWPNKLVAFPANYQLHIDEMNSKNRANHNGFFLMANSSIGGPNDPIVMPAMTGISIHHECELGVVIGKQGRDIPVEDALDHVFGYFCLMDITLRGPQERVARKSFDSFTPTGPWIVTKDEISDPANLDMSLSVNGELRQQANTRDLLLTINEMIAMTSAITTLYPGDLIATGTPEGVGPIAVGDEVSISIAEVGSMQVPVTAARRGSGFDLQQWAERKG